MHINVNLFIFLTVTPILEEGEPNTFCY